MVGDRPFRKRSPRLVRGVQHEVFLESSGETKSLPHQAARSRDGLPRQAGQSARRLDLGCDAGDPSLRWDESLS